jgi:hypothetical protein
MLNGKIKLPRSVEAVHGVEFEILGSGIALVHIDGGTMQIIARDHAPVIVTDRRSGEQGKRASGLRCL